MIVRKRYFDFSAEHSCNANGGACFLVYIYKKFRLKSCKIVKLQQLILRTHSGIRLIWIN